MVNNNSLNNTIMCAKSLDPCIALLYVTCIQSHYMHFLVQHNAIEKYLKITATIVSDVNGVIQWGDGLEDGLK